MTPEEPSLPCPACNHQVHPSAERCMRCGYRAPGGRVRELLGSLVFVASILAGFGLASVVQLASIEGERRNDWSILITAGCWICGSVFMLAIIFVAEMLRGNEDLQRLDCPEASHQRLLQQTQTLLTWFTVSLLPFVVGIITLGFFFAPLLCGVCVLVAMVAGAWMGWILRLS